MYTHTRGIRGKLLQRILISDFSRTRSEGISGASAFSSVKIACVSPLTLNWNATVLIIYVVMTEL